MGDNGANVVPWGRLHTGQKGDILKALEGADAGGPGLPSRFW
jgi:hypothetical protein